MTVYTEPNNLADFLVHESDREYSRDVVTFLSGETISLGEVVGKIVVSCPTTGDADAGNTGDGTCASVTAGENTKIGTYTLTCIAAAANAGTFAVKDPDGVALPDATVAVAYENKNINFTLTDGATDFIVGDIFTIDVVVGSGKYVEVDASAVDGSQNAVGIAISDYDASAADMSGVIIARDAIITTSNLVWPSGATEAQKTNWLSQLAEAGIIEREES
ncbi:MAG TPA: head decoration protein [Desulfobacteraceae bacterium]|nr:head decoration protein [Desulfobacteraceae bacterium]|tara:strand:- start:136 stop:792 length:657 start_codon:yes stop_codon:yes gene_type:complete